MGDCRCACGSGGFWGSRGGEAELGEMPGSAVSPAGGGSSWRWYGWWHGHGLRGTCSRGEGGCGGLLLSVAAVLRRGLLSKGVEHRRQSGHHGFS